ncbi:antA/AntB antirepressor family protein, partial [Bartonella queenslandensis]
MNILIKISEQTIGQEAVQTVNARELHVFLEVKRDFSNWIKDRINKYSFLKNQDYIVLANFGENLQGGRPSKEYHLTLDMAKELSMVERNEKGRQARRYFIECEKKLKSQ